jgi:hypothetical protein
MVNVTTVEPAVVKLTGGRRADDFGFGTFEMKRAHQTSGLGHLLKIEKRTTERVGV